jgi:hypothetical protein
MDRYSMDLLSWEYQTKLSEPSLEYQLPKNNICCSTSDTNADTTTQTLARRNGDT